MRGLLMAGQRELHFKTEKDARRRTLADAIARLPVAVHVYSCEWGRHDEPARQNCLQRLAGDLIAEGLQRLVIDSRNERDIHDERTLRRALSPHPAASRVVYEHLPSEAEPLLWIADAAAWCYGAGGAWRERVAGLIARHD
jgi:hypothetical protein